MRLNASNYRRFIPALGFALATLLLSGIAGADERLWLEATINGKDAKLVFDTGTSHLVLLQRGAVRLGVSFTNAPEDFEPAPGTISSGKSEECELQLGGSTVKTRFAVVQVPNMLPVEFDGLLGWRPLANNIIWIDANKGEVSCLDSLPDRVTNWTKFAIMTNSDDLELEVPVSNLETAVVAVDTGFSGGVALAPGLWREWKATHSNAPVTLDAYYMPGAGLVVAEETWAKRLAAGALVLSEVPITEANDTVVLRGSPGYQMTLGLEALKRLDFIADGKGGFAYLHIKETPAPAYQHNRLGAVFTPASLDSEDLIARVADGSPAWKAGIRHGDSLISIGKLDVTKWRTDPAVLPLSRFWERPPGTQLELTLKRNEKEFKAVVVLEQILPQPADSSTNP